ncbi:MAG: Sapep family Mn(2+)-dependent dipeptidase [Atopobiaceae bacterium]
MADEQLKADVDAYVDEVWEDVIKDMDYLVQVESVEDKNHAEPGKPWGPAPYEALSRAIEIASRMGLKAHDCEGYIGFADLEGASEKYVATIAHTDIVPLGTGWTFDPLHVTRKDGFLIGRGVLDDKGPFVLSLYALNYFRRAVEKSATKLPVTLRAIIGCNEETNMLDVDYYLKHYPEPEFLFTPDANFPLICGEKGLYSATFTTGAISENIVELAGGTVGNAIPGLAHAVVKADPSRCPAADGIDVEPQGDGLVKLTAHGKGGHASLPEGTKNAIGMLVDYLLASDIPTAKERQFLEFEQKIFASTDGSSLGIAATDDIFDPLTLIGGTIKTVDGHFEQTVDCRFPKSTTSDFISDQLKKLAAGFEVAFSAGRAVKPFYTDPNSAEIQTLLSTYNEYSGKHGQAFTIGGGTYARHFSRACAFGPFDAEAQYPAWVGMEHGPDEGIAEDQLKMALKIYIVSIARLMRLYE